MQNSPKSPIPDLDSVHSVDVFETQRNDNTEIVQNYSNPDIPEDNENLCDYDHNRLGDTMYSRRFIHQLLFKLCEEAECEHTEDIEEIDEEFEKQLSDLWDMSTDEEVVNYLMDVDALKLFSFVIECTNKPRLTEMLVGIMVNMICIPHENSDYFKSNRNLWYVTIIMMLKCRDAAKLLQALRFLRNLRDCGRMTDMWREEMMAMNFWDDFNFILLNSTNVNLRDEVARMLFYLTEDSETVCMYLGERENFLKNFSEIITSLLDRQLSMAVWHLAGVLNNITTFLSDSATLKNIAGEVWECCFTMLKIFTNRWSNQFLSDDEITGLLHCFRVLDSVAEECVITSHEAKYLKKVQPILAKTLEFENDEIQYEILQYLVSMEFPLSESFFAQKLASCQPKIRTRALLHLRSWITDRSRNQVFKETELSVLWKGLYYAMWMQDKPLQQEELADNIGELMECFSTLDEKLTFQLAFFTTVSSEWHTIDKWRLNKFMMLTRRFLRSMLRFFDENDWKETIIDRVLEFLKLTVLNPSISDYPEGLKFHFASLYLDELDSLMSEKLDEQRSMRMLQPYVELLAKPISPIFFDTVINEVFEPILLDASQSFVKEKSAKSKSQKFQSNGLKINYKRLSDELFEVAACCGSKRRQRIYEFVKKFQLVSIECDPLSEEESSDVSDLDLDDVQKATERLLKQEQLIKESYKNISTGNSRKKFLKRRKKKANSVQLKGKIHRKKRPLKKKNKQMALVEEVNYDLMNWQLIKRASFVTFEELQPHRVGSILSIILHVILSIILHNRNLTVSLQ
ncbi:Ribosomal RNA processing protein 1 -like protein, partial [Trichinella pseudospiralis]